MTPKQITTLAFVLAVIVIGWSLVWSIAIHQNAGEYIVVQAPFSGVLTTYTNQGVHPLWFGTATRFKLRDTYEFEYPVRFNDGGHGTIHGSVQFTLPSSPELLTKLLRTYHDQEGIKSQLIQKVVDRSLYFTGPLLSSTESYASKRNYLINWAEDQINNGIYKTISKDVKVIDPITGQEKTQTIVDIVVDNGVPQRQEAAILSEYGVVTSNFTIQRIDYEATVEAQIKQQQQLAMSVQTSIANAKLAEQAAITAEENGKAEAAKAKWAQEVIKATAVTQAEQTRDVNKLNAEAATYYKQEQILEGEGDAEKQRLKMQANGALEEKLKTYKEVQQMWADAFKNYQGNLVPSVVTGGSYGAAGNAGINFMELMGIKAAKDLSLDLAVPAGAGKR